MTDLKKNEIIKDKKGNHYRFFSLENTQADANAVCQQLSDNGFQAASFERDDNHLIEVFTKFTKAEEIIFLLKERNCGSLCKKDKTFCNEKECKIQADIEDTLWKEKLGWYSLIDAKLRKLRQIESEVKS